MPEIQLSASTILQHSSGPIRWMPTGSPHRAIIEQRVFVADTSGVLELDGITPSQYLDPMLEHTRFEDEVITKLSVKFPGLRPLTDGGLWQGLLTSITGQAVSLHSAAAFQRRQCEMLSEPNHAHGRQFRALPSAELVASCSVEQVKSIGLTTKRAEGLVYVAQSMADKEIPDPPKNDIDAWMKDLTALPMIGPWTAASALLWGVGHADAYPPGDVALLRAARGAYNDDGMTMKDLNTLSDKWRPQRSVAARLLWTNLLGLGWDTE